MAQQTTAWDAIFRERGRVFTQPQEDMPALADALQARGGATLLDLGCGTGRHVVYFAECGFAVSGLDSSPEGLRQTAEALRAAGRTADLRLGDIYAPLPYADAAFDAVIAVQVIHHARLIVTNKRRKMANQRRWERWATWRCRGTRSTAARSASSAGSTGRPASRA